MKADNTETADRSHVEGAPAQLFWLRVWRDDGPGEHDWHGRVQHSVTGEAHPFRTCAELKHLIRDMIARRSNPFIQEP